MRQEAQRVLQRLGADLSPAQPMRTLSVAQMQMVEIAKALAHRAELIIMDEPTSALSDREVQALFRVIHELKEQGVAVLYTSHKLEEIFRIADTVTVFRDGRYIASHPIREVDEPMLIDLMVGGALQPVPTPLPGEKGPIALDVRGLTKTGEFHNIHLAVRQGEILGLTGLMGAGRTEFVSALCGLASADAGEVRVNGRLVRITSPRDAMAAGMTMVSEDRQRYGLVPRMRVRQNITLASLRRWCRAVFIDHRLERRVADEQLQRFSIRGASREQSVCNLSGGNQQKVVLAKALLAAPSVLILDEPTRGIDIGAKADVHALILELARQGKAILLVSSELPEVLSLSDRLLVMRGGSLVAELDSRQATQAEVLRHAMAGQGTPSANT